MSTDDDPPTDEELLRQLQELDIAFNSGKLSSREIVDNVAKQLMTLSVLRTRGVDEVRIFTAIRAVDLPHRPS